MNTSLFEKFSAAIRAGAVPDDARLQLGASGPLAVYYARFEAMNHRAKLVPVGITPGRVQAANALAEARRQLEAGAPVEEAMRKSKQTGAFSGPMRTNLVEMLDHSAVVILASPNTRLHSPKLRLVVIITLVCSYSLDSRWNSNAPPAWLKGGAGPDGLMAFAQVSIVNPLGLTTRGVRRRQGAFRFGGLTNG